MRAKPYKARTLNGAQAEVRRLRAMVKDMDRAWGYDYRRLREEREMLAKLAMGPYAFSDPADLEAAKELRNKIRAELGINPDGTPREN